MTAGSGNPQYRKEHRTDPLPAGVWIVQRDKTYHALRVTGPGSVELSDGSRRKPRSMQVTAVKPGWWRRWRLRLVDEKGAATVLRVIPFGEAGMADVGQRTRRGVGGDAMLSDSAPDTLAPIMFLAWIGYSILAAPVVIHRRIRCSRVARDIGAAIFAKQPL